MMTMTMMMDGVTTPDDDDQGNDFTRPEAVIRKIRGLARHSVWWISCFLLRLVWPFLALMT